MDNVMQLTKQVDSKVYKQLNRIKHLHIDNQMPDFTFDTEEYYQACKDILAIVIADVLTEEDKTIHSINGVSDLYDNTNGCFITLNVCKK